MTSDVCALKRPDQESQFPKRSPVSGSRVFPDSYPGVRPLSKQPGLWPAQWISIPFPPPSPLMVVYRLRVSIAREEVIRLHVTADERYELILGKTLLSSGPERGAPGGWHFESVDVHLQPGEHLLVAKVWSLGEKAPYAQLSLRHGFFLCPDDDARLMQFATGLANWECRLIDGYDWQEPLATAWATGWKQVIDGRKVDWDALKGRGDGWELAVAGPYGESAEAVRGVALQKTGVEGHRLIPATLPPMKSSECRPGRVRHVAAFSNRPVGLKAVTENDSLVEEQPLWQMLLEGRSALTIPPFCKRRVIIDLENYFCAIPHLLLSEGLGAEVELDWAEALYEDITIPEGMEEIEACMWPKGNRDELEGKYFICPWNRKDGPGDRYLANGKPEQSFSPLSWRAGRYVQLLVETNAQSLVIERITFQESRYPLEMEGTFSSSDENLNSILPMLVRGAQMCAHETYMDCPFYEQLMYAGDTRLQILVTYVMSVDERLPRKALSLFNASRLSCGLPQSRFPAKIRQTIPPFAIWWIGMCHDYALWRGDADFMKGLLPGIRAVCDYFAALIDKQGYLHAPAGWNFVDWVPEWNFGIPPDGEEGTHRLSGVLHWQAVLGFRLAAELETWYGEPELAQLGYRRADTVAKAAHQLFWDETRGLYADDVEHTRFSEHAQCMAVLSGRMPEEYKPALRCALLEAKDLSRATIYFTHYLFETYYHLNAGEAVLERLEQWSELGHRGLKTPIESPEPNRSDCHGWGAHPLYHFYATLCGIRPGSPGFQTVVVEPLEKGLSYIDVTLPHPKGDITVRGATAKPAVSLPAGVRWMHRKT